MYILRQLRLFRFFGEIRRHLVNLIKWRDTDMEISMLEGSTCQNELVYQMYWNMLKVWGPGAAGAAGAAGVAGAGAGAASADALQGVVVVQQLRQAGLQQVRRAGGQQVHQAQQRQHGAPHRQLRPCFIEGGHWWLNVTLRHLIN